MSWQQIPCETETRPDARGLVRLGSPDALSWSRWQGRVSCVYIDPPFYTGELFCLNQRVGEAGWKTGRRTVKLQAYSDRFESREAYLSLIRTLAQAARGLLSDEGALFVHVDTRADAHVRLLLDELFNERNFVNQIIWAYQSGGRSTKYYSRKHDVIFFYRKTGKLHFDITHVPIPRGENRQNHMRRTVDENGRPCRTIRSGGKTYFYYDDDPVYPSDVWADVSHLQQKDPQRTGYDTQKPESLLRRVLLPVTEPDDIVADLCCGSGTTAVAAALTGRRFVVCDIGKPAIAVTRKRLVSQGIPFDLEAPCRTEPAKASVRIYPGIAFADVCLTDFTPPEPWPDGVTGLDGVDQWSVGTVEHGVFRACDDAARTQKDPALPPSLQIPLLSGTPAVLVTDILGNRYCFACRDD